MKSLLAGIVWLLVLSFAAPAQARSPLTVLVMIATPQEEKEACVLISSLRTFGGDYREAPVVIVLSDPSKADGKSLAGKAQEIVPLKMNERFRQFPFADKVYACAQVEAMAAYKTDWLLWLNPDCLIVAPPVEITADRNAWAALRPVHLQNIGISPDVPVTDFWKRIYEVAGLDPAAAWTVESLVDHQKLRGYFNSGCMAFAPDRGLLRSWKDNFERLLTDPANFAFYSGNQANAIFCHQAVLSATAMAKAGRESIRMLPPAYGYPLQLQDQPGFTNRCASLADLTIVITGGFDQLSKIQVPEPFKDWVARNAR